MNQPPIPSILNFLRSTASEVLQSVHEMATYANMKYLTLDTEADPTAERSFELFAKLRKEGFYVPDEPAVPYPMRASVQGLPQIAADRWTHREIADRIREEYRGRVLVVGEEAGDADWDAAFDSPSGTIIVVVDSIDGSLPFDTIGCGFSTNMVIYRRTDAAEFGVATLAQLVCSSNGRDLLVMHPSAVFTGHRGLRLEARHEFRYEAEDVRRGTIAGVSVQPHHRVGGTAVLWDTDLSWGLSPYESGGRTYYDPPLSPIGLGGAPMFIEMLNGRLESILLAHRQTIHDAAGVLALALLGAHCFDLSGEPISVERITEAFRTFGRPHTTEYTPIDPMVVSRSEDLGRLIAQRVGEAQATGMRLRATLPADQKPRLFVVRDQDEAGGEHA